MKNHIPIVITLVGLAGYISSDFFVRVNDFWGILTLAKEFSFFKAHHYYNGFFPILTILFYKGPSALNSIPSIIIIQLLLSTLLLIHFTQQQRKKSQTLTILVLLSFYPFVKFLFVPGPYIIFCLLSAIAYLKVSKSQFFSILEKQSNTKTTDYRR